MENHIQIDETDRIILRILQHDAKKTVKEIAQELRLSVSPVYERIRKLEQQGIIKKYIALLDTKTFKKSIIAFCQVSMLHHNEAFIEKFEQHIQQFDEVLECYHMAGQVDFILKIIVENLEAYHNFVRNKLSKLENIGMLNSSFVLKEIKHTTAIDVD